jgi:hypothetical protein
MFAAAVIDVAHDLHPGPADVVDLVGREIFVEFVS